MRANYLDDDDEDLLPLKDDDEEDRLPESKFPVAAAADTSRILGLDRPPVQPGMSFEASDAAQKRGELASAIKSKPNAPQPKWYQRLAAAAMGAGAGWVNAAGRTRPIDISAATRGIMAPGYDRKLDDWRNRVSGAQAASDASNANEQSWLKNWQAKNQEELQNSQERRNDAMAGYEASRNATALEGKKIADAEKQDALFTKGREEDAISFDPATEQAPPGYITKQSAANPKMMMAIPPRFQKLTEDLADFATGRKVGDIIPYSEFKRAQKAANDNQIKNTNKPQAEKAKDAFQNIMSTVADEGLISEDSITNAGKLSRAIKASQRLKPEQKSQALAYLATNTTPGSTGSTATIRVEGITESKPITVIDSQTGQAETMNMAEFNRSNKLAPGRYVQAGTAVPTMSKEAIFRDINYNIRNARTAISALDDMDAGTRAELAVALKDPDPKSAIGAFLTGTAGSTMTPQQEDAVIALRNLYENAMTLRQVGGMGQGSDQLRAAIQATLPSARTPSKGYALKQINQFEQIVKNLHTAVPGLGRDAVKVDEPHPSGNTGGRGGGNPNPTGYVVGHVYGGLTYLGGDPNQQQSWRK